ncbi:MAG: glycosyltransferase family 2 protein [Candidatus Ozemobacteraceae bacterium]
MTDTIIVIPAFNEARIIGGVIENVRKAVGESADILVVNDGSSDSTVAVARQSGAVVVSHPFNLGYGAAIQTGYKYAIAQGYSFLAQIDGDGQHDPAFLSALLEPVRRGEIDLALGSRFLEPGSYRPPFIRRVGMAFFGVIVSLLIGKRIGDPTTGFQAFNRPVMEFLIRDLFPCDYPDADVLIMLGLEGFRMREIPVRMLANREGKSMHSGLQPFYYVFKMILSIAVTLLRHSPRRNSRHSQQ